MPAEGSDQLVVVDVGDRVTEQTTAPVGDALPGAQVVVLDLSRVSFLDSAGLTHLVNAHTRCEQHAAELRVVVADPVVTRPMELTGLDRVLRLFPTLDHARR
ncbi:STAS domain-containing protein [Actinokineospora bangkokensis]|uniref:Anti-sigma factor antagonist n=1 Tax=Actinokineospora bangkokensis TaxID=1193682 RepID=A0A1Q9LSM7_9PSEU|nr:STAS domain-containing protein [Actinokineospora bangkokensis]OLR95042.1 hypothetical protein BJP25_08790 [Actinokineospora bangkokensis]